MKTIQLHLDPETAARARKLAAARNCTLDEIIKAGIELIEQAASSPDLVLGSFRDEAELLDEIVADAMSARQRPLRLPSAKNSA
jgi:hypothetical protein